MMAAVDVILLSSPHRLSGRHVAALSSSPNFPSPASLLQKRPQLHTKSRVAPIQVNATSRLANAAGLRRKNLVDEGLDFGEGAPSTIIEKSIWDIPSDTLVRSNTAGKPRISKGTIDQDEAGLKKLRKPRAKKANTEVEDGGILREKPAPKGRAKKATKIRDRDVTMERPPRKPRSSKAAANGQAKIPKSRVTKPLSTTPGEKVIRKKKTETASRSFSSVMKDQEDPFDADGHSCNDLQLQEAVKRRMSWTPPPPETQETERSITPTVEDVFGMIKPNTSTVKQVSITDLLGGFSHKGELARDPPARVVDPLGPKKRKLIELVKTNVSAQQNPATKVAAKKKPRTITEKATSVYAVDNEQKAGSAPTSLSRFFSHPTLTPEGTQEIDSFKVPPKARSKSPIKTSAKTALSSKEAAMTTLLLSPQSALRRVDDQQFVFGTCSQLAREESPTLLRDLHEAMRASNQIEGDPYEQIVDHATAYNLTTTEERGTGSCVAKRNLWAAASNRINNGQKDIEMVDLSESPILTKIVKPTIIQPTRAGERTVPKEAEEDKWLKLDGDSEFGAAAGAKVSSTVPVSIGQRDTRSSAQGDSAVSESRINVMNSSTEGSIIQKPNYGSYPTAQLAKEIASYRFKPLKSRDKMIALLERCWEGKQNVARSALGATTHSIVASMPSSQTRTNAKLGFPTGSSDTTQAKSKDATKSSSPRRPISRARSKEPLSKIVAKPLTIRLTPKKPKVDLIVEEISDSDTPLTPSPPRRHQSQLPSPPPPLPLKPSSIGVASKQTSKNKSNATTTDISDQAQSQREDLHRAIAMAITSAPRSRDAQTPSWHEKILLYDPIVLEDLAEWLNNGELARVGWKGGFDGNEAVSAAEVKAWCLSKSICCLWKENLRGGARSRY